MEWVRPAAPHHVVKSHIVLEGNKVSKFTRRDAASNPTAPAAESTDEKKEYIEDAPIVVEFFNEADEPMEVYFRSGHLGSQKRKLVAEIAMDSPDEKAKDCKNSAF